MKTAYKLRFVSFAAFALFLALGAALWGATGSVFFILNFGYIGAVLSLGLFLEKGKRRPRRAVQLGVGLYMLAGLGILLGENMQIEGFWFYLFGGMFQAAVIHYLAAKLAGPLIFGRGWCGWACWTAMIFDLLPYKTPQGARRKRLGAVRYAVFALSPCFVGWLLMFRGRDAEHIIYVSFIAGNALYYGAGIALAFALRDNRAFCKYECPVTVFLKPMSYFALLRVKPDAAKCVSCGKCAAVCPMDVDMTNPRRSRRRGTECILCGECVRECPQKALKLAI